MAAVDTGGCGGDLIRTCLAVATVPIGSAMLDNVVTDVAERIQCIRYHACNRDFWAVFVGAMADRR